MNAGSYLLYSRNAVERKWEVVDKYGFISTMCGVRSCLYHRTKAWAEESTMLKSCVGFQLVLPYLVSLLCSTQSKAHVTAAHVCSQTVPA